MIEETLTRITKELVDNLDVDKHRNMFKASVMDKFSDYMSVQNKRTYWVSGARHGHDTWNELRPYTIRLKKERKYKYPLMPLIATGAMAKGDYAIINNYEIGFSNKLPYAKKHQYGEPEKRLPQREFMFFSKQDIEKALSLVNSYFEGQLK